MLKVDDSFKVAKHFQRLGDAKLIEPFQRLGDAKLIDVLHTGMNEFMNLMRLKCFNSFK